MIVSQILLLGFVSYWLIGQYRQERMQLQEELRQEFLSEYESQVDSLLMKHLIAPTLSDSLMLQVDLSEVRDFEPKADTAHTSILIKHLDSDTAMSRDVFAFRMNDSIGLEEERLVRSVKLFINETDAAFRSDASTHVFAMKIDSSALLDMLNQRFRDKDWNFTLDWFQEKDQSAEASNKARPLRITSPHPEFPTLQVEHINPYLLGLMLPQFIFALVLLCISASALIIAYRSLKKQVMLNELRNDFIANISHELKTPVSTVKVALEALQKFDLKRDQQVTGDYLEMASREADRLEGLVGKVLQHQLLEDPGALLQHEACDLNEIMASAVQAMELAIRDKKADIQVTEAEGPCLVMADPVYVEGVIINLIDNSLKYAGPHPEIQIRTECTKDRKLLKVRDHGPGIPDKFKEQVYDKFFRIPAGDRHNVKGYGLGLNFAAQVMAQLGGSISFTNPPDGGCEFVLNFPEM